MKIRNLLSKSEIIGLGVVIAAVLIPGPDGGTAAMKTFSSIWLWGGMIIPLIKMIGDNYASKKRHEILIQTLFDC